MRIVASSCGSCMGGRASNSEKVRPFRRRRICATLSQLGDPRALGLARHPGDAPVELIDHVEEALFELARAKKVQQQAPDREVNALPLVRSAQRIRGLPDAIVNESIAWPVGGLV